MVLPSIRRVMARLDYPHQPGVTAENSRGTSERKVTLDQLLDEFLVEVVAPINIVMPNLPAKTSREVRRGEQNKISFFSRTRTS